VVGILPSALLLTVARVHSKLNNSYVPRVAIRREEDDSLFCNPKAHAMSIRKMHRQTHVHSCCDTTWKTHGLKQTCTHAVIQFVTPLLAPYDVAWEKDCELNRLAEAKNHHQTWFWYNEDSVQ